MQTLGEKYCELTKVHIDLQKEVDETITLKKKVNEAIVMREYRVKMSRTKNAASKCRRQKMTRNKCFRFSNVQSLKNSNFVRDVLS